MQEQENERPISHASRGGYGCHKTSFFLVREMTRGWLLLLHQFDDFRRILRQLLLLD